MFAAVLGSFDVRVLFAPAEIPLSRAFVDLRVGFLRLSFPSTKGEGKP